MLPLYKDDDPTFKYTANDVRQILESGDRERMREVSTHFYAVSGIYRRLVQLFATMPNYDHMVIPHILNDKINEKRVMRDFNEAMEVLDTLDLKLILPNITLNIFKFGMYCGYMRDDFGDDMVIQSLPLDYCQSNYKVNNRYTVEFNLNYFDREFYDSTLREKVLDQFPKEIKNYYNQLKSGALSGQDAEWVLLDPERAFTLKMPDEMPFFLPIIIDLIELREAKNVELSKDRLELFQLLIQRLPIGKDDQLIFDLPEAQELHKNALSMLQHNEHIDVLTTFADMEMLNIKEARQVVKDNLLKTERSVFNEAGVSSDLFRSEGNIALKYSIQTNEAILSLLLPQYMNWLSHVITLRVTRNPRYYFEVFIPPVTIFNAKEMEERYIKLGTLGYSKLLPGIITGMKQSSLINMIKFENNFLQLNDIMEPLQSTHTQSGKAGRPKSPDEEKDPETIENINADTQEEGGDS